jgi:hypothetical protein
LQVPVNEMGRAVHTMIKLVNELKRFSVFMRLVL